MFSLTRTLPQHCPPPTHTCTCLHACSYHCLETETESCGADGERGMGGMGGAQVELCRKSDGALEAVRCSMLRYASHAPSSTALPLRTHHEARGMAGVCKGRKGGKAELSGTLLIMTARHITLTKLHGCEMEGGPCCCQAATHCLQGQAGPLGARASHLRGNLDQASTSLCLRTHVG